MKRWATLATLIWAMGMQGCAFFTKPLEMPVIEEKLNRSWMNGAAVGTLSLTPERRVVLVNFSNNRFCAEAPTEVGVDLASISEFAAKLASGDPGKPSLESKLLQTLSSKNDVLNKRTQGMQLFLANAYFTCQMYMNGGIDAAQMLEMQFQALKYATPLIEQELGLMYGTQGSTQGGAKEAASGKPNLSSDAIRSDAARTTREVLQKQDARPIEQTIPTVPPVSKP